MSQHTQVVSVVFCARAPSEGSPEPLAKGLRRSPRDSSVVEIQPSERFVVLPIDDIDVEDKTFCFRIGLDVNALALDLEANGQDVPVVVRRVEGRARLQPVCGFRRLTALRGLGATQVKALVRRLTDDEAYRLAWSENECRGSYRELDRANAILKAHRAGHTLEELQDLFGLQRKQLGRLKMLAFAPKAIRVALDRSAISTTHAVVLVDLRRQHPDLDVEHWAGEIERMNLSVRQLRLLISRIYTDHQESEPLISLRDEAIVLKRGTIDLSELTPEQRSEALELGRRLLALMSKGS